MSENKPRVNFTLDPDVAALLKKTGNASEYVTRAIRERWQAWQDALDELRGHEWQTNEVRAALDALNGYSLLGPGRAPSFVAAELSDAYKLSGLGEKWDVSSQRWSALVRKVSESWQLSTALTTVAQEFWSGNEACDAAIERLLPTRNVKPPKLP